MTDDQRDIIVELIRNTIDYLHKQEVMLIQLAGTIEMEKEHPEPTPAEKTGVDEREFRKQLDEHQYQYPFPWGRNLGKKTGHGPGITTIIANNELKGGVLLEDLPKGVLQMIQGA